LVEQIGGCVKFFHGLVLTTIENALILHPQFANRGKLTIAKVAQLVERDLAKVEVAGSNPVFRSTKKAPLVGAFFVNAGMVELVDTPDLKSCGPQARAGSTPAPGTSFPNKENYLLTKPLIISGFCVLEQIKLLSMSITWPTRRATAG